jgi:hypothetical protein
MRRLRFCASLEGRSMSISVSEDQFLTIARAAAVLHPADRDPFVASVAHELEGKPIGDGAVARAVVAAFKTFFHPPEEAAHPPSRWNRS